MKKSRPWNRSNQNGRESTGPVATFLKSLVPFFVPFVAQSSQPAKPPKAPK